MIKAVIVKDDGIDRDPLLQCLQRYEANRSDIYYGKAIVPVAAGKENR